MSEFAVIMIPFAGTVLGSMLVLFMKKAMNEKVEKLLLGFAAGVMVAAAVWSLIVPAIEMAENRGQPGWLPALAGFMLGVGFLLFIDTVVPHQHLECDKPEGCALGKPSKKTMMLLAITIHNLPEGMAVGVAFAGAAAAGSEMTLAGAMTLAIGIAIQNFPEGAVVSMPLRSEGASRGRAFLLGTLSGAVEPLGALLAIIITSFITPLLPYVLAFAAGTMFYVVVEELIPESQAGDHTNIGTIGAAVGFALMMVLDVALG